MQKFHIFQTGSLYDGFKIIKMYEISSRFLKVDNREQSSQFITEMEQPSYLYIQSDLYYPIMLRVIFCLDNSRFIK